MGNSGSIPSAPPNQVPPSLPTDVRLREQNPYSTFEQPLDAYRNPMNSATSSSVTRSGEPFDPRLYVDQRTAPEAPDARTLSEEELQDEEWVSYFPLRLVYVAKRKYGQCVATHWRVDTLPDGEQVLYVALVKIKPMPYQIKQRQARKKLKVISVFKNGRPRVFQRDLLIETIWPDVKPSGVMWVINPEGIRKKFDIEKAKRCRFEKDPSDSPELAKNKAAIFQAIADLMRDHPADTISTFGFLNLETMNKDYGNAEPIIPTLESQKPKYPKYTPKQSEIDEEYQKLNKDFNEELFVENPDNTISIRPFSSPSSDTPDSIKLSTYTDSKSLEQYKSSALPSGPKTENVTDDTSNLIPPSLPSSANISREQAQQISSEYGNVALKIGAPHGGGGRGGGGRGGGGRGGGGRGGGRGGSFHRGGRGRWVINKGVRRWYPYYGGGLLGLGLAAGLAYDPYAYNSDPYYYQDPWDNYLTY